MSRSAPIFTVEYRGHTAQFYDIGRPDHIHDTMKKTGAFYEKDLLESIFQRCPPGKAMIDVGANIGTHSIFFATALSGHVYAFEPEPLNFSRLRSNVALNHLDQRVTCQQIAIGKLAGHADTKIIDPANMGKSVIEVHDNGNTEVVPLDSLTFDRPIGVLKIDVEGGEGDVIAGATTLINTQKPLIYAEAVNEDAFRRVEARLKPFAYHLCQRYCHTPTYLFTCA